MLAIFLKQKGDSWGADVEDKKEVQRITLQSIIDSIHTFGDAYYYWLFELSFFHNFWLINFIIWSNIELMAMLVSFFNRKHNLQQTGQKRTTILFSIKLIMSNIKKESFLRTITKLWL